MSGQPVSTIRSSAGPLVATPVAAISGGEVIFSYPDYLASPSYVSTPYGVSQDRTFSYAIALLRTPGETETVVEYRINEATVVSLTLDAGEERAEGAISVTITPADSSYATINTSGYQAAGLTFILI